MLRKLLTASIVAVCTFASSASDPKLSGTVIGSTYSVDYSTGSKSTTVNTAASAFDGNLNTFFASYDRSYTWAGLDLGEKYVITRVGWSPRNDGLGPGRTVLGLFQGANSPDFLDAVPIFMVTEKGSIGTIDHADVTCSRGFRYVRYVGPSDARCNIAEIEFYGHKGEGDDSNLYRITNLPTVCINTVNAEEPYDKEHNIISQIIVLSEEDGQPYILDAPGESRLRGNASMQFPKKPYRIKFDKKQRVLPDAPAKVKKWTLINNYGDKTLMRNAIAFEASRLTGLGYTPYCRPVDVVLNGEYKGNYQLCDQVEINPGRVDIDEMTPEDIAGDALTGGYLIEVDGYADQEVSWFMSSSGIPVTIKSPDEEEITPEQKKYITDLFNDMDSRISKAQYNETTGYRAILDMPSFLRHFIVGEFSGNTDTYWSTYFYKRRNDPHLYCGPVWDFDIAFDNDSRTYPVNDKSEYICLHSSASSAGTMSNFARKVIYWDSKTKTELMHLWSDMRNSRDFTPDHFSTYIDNLASDMDASLRLNFMRWPILNQWVHQNPKVYDTYGDAIRDVKDFTSERIAWLDNKIGYDPEYTSVPDIEAESHALSASVIAGRIHVSAEASIFDPCGRLVGTATSSAPLALPSPGVYIAVAPGLAAAKVMN